MWNKTGDWAQADASACQRFVGLQGESTRALGHMASVATHQMRIASLHDNAESTARPLCPSTEVAGSGSSFRLLPCTADPRVLTLCSPTYSVDSAASQPSFHCSLNSPHGDLVEPARTSTPLGCSRGFDEGLGGIGSHNAAQVPVLALGQALHHDNGPSDNTDHGLAGRIFISDIKVYSW